jgi:hypothetical protein
MGARLDVSENDALEVATGNAREIKEDVIAMVAQILEDRQRPRGVRSAIAQEDCLLGATHVQGLAQSVQPRTRDQKQLRSRPPRRAIAGRTRRDALMRISCGTAIRRTHTVFTAGDISCDIASAPDEKHGDCAATDEN